MLVMNLSEIPAILHGPTRAPFGGGQEHSSADKPAQGDPAPDPSAANAIAAATTDDAVDADGGSPADGTIVDGGAVNEAAPDGDGAVVDRVVSTTTASDGTELPSLRFEHGSKTTLSPEMYVKFKQVAAYMNNNFGMKVTLRGHGDEGMKASEYVTLGRRRSAALYRLLIDHGVKEARIAVEPVAVEGDRVLDKGVAPGAMELVIEPRFQPQKKGGTDAP